MKPNCVRTLLALGVVSLAGLAPLRAHAACYASSMAGNWAYTDTGTILTPNGPVPAASVGHFHQDFSGEHHRQSDAQCSWPIRARGHFGNEFGLSGDCTSSFTINVFVNGQLLRTAQLAAFYDQRKPCTGDFSIADSAGWHERPSRYHHRRKQGDVETVVLWAGLRVQPAISGNGTDLFCDSKSQITGALNLANASTVQCTNILGSKYESLP